MNDINLIYEYLVIKVIYHKYSKFAVSAVFVFAGILKVFVHFFSLVCQFCLCVNRVEFCPSDLNSSGQKSCSFFGTRQNLPL